MPEDICIGIDTSCYTTSVAAATATGIVFAKKTMLFVDKGQRGLRQSEGLFQHVKQLPELMESLFREVDRASVSCVAVSRCPTDEEGSYMPVFLAGYTLARSLAAAMGVPLYETTHQRGHVRAALIHNERLMDTARLAAFHLSGGTTDLMLVSQKDGQIDAITRLGSANDLHVGQFVDRVGVSIGLPFPCGRELERLANGAAARSIKIPASVNALSCSFSGAETRAQQLIQSGVDANEVAFAVYDCIARTLTKLISNFRERYGNQPILFSGGVASSLLLRELLKKRRLGGLYFAEPCYAADNACGVALIGIEANQHG